MATSTEGGWPGNPIIHEVNTWAWLSEVGERLGLRVGLGDLTDEHWDEIVLPGIDAVWLMGVWARSEEGRRIAEENPQIRGACDAVLPDRTPADFASSAYCIQEYRVVPKLPLATDTDKRLNDLEKRLEELMRVYRTGLVRKAQALKVAVSRGLRPRLS